MSDLPTPYPWDRLPRLSAAQARTATSIARWFASIDTQQASEITRALLGCTVQVTGIALSARRPNPHAPTLEIDGDAHVIVELSGPLSAWIVDRALGGDATLKRLEAGPSLRNEAARGVLAYVAARVLQTWPGHHAVTDVFADATQALRDHPAASVTCFAVRLAWDGVELPIHLWVLREPAVVTRFVVHRPLRDVLLQERVILSAQLMGRASLRVGQRRSMLVDDVLMLAGPEIAYDEQGYAGRVQLRVHGSRTHVWIGHLHHERIELQERLTMEHDGLTSGALLSPSTITEELTPVADAPLELSVEIARFTLPLSTIASLTAGEVLLTGRPVGQHVTLRAGSRAIATGELVSVDGAIGVRVLTLAGG